MSPDMSSVWSRLVGTFEPACLGVRGDGLFVQSAIRSGLETVGSFRCVVCLNTPAGITNRPNVG
jgi:hypothetical protein